MHYPEPISKLIDSFMKLPGIGPKTAQRLAFHVLDMKEDDVVQFAKALVDVKRELTYCNECGHITEQDPCYICQDKQRDRSIICVVEDDKDVIAMEKMREYKGLYHVLHGSISPMDGIGPEDINIPSLINRLKNDEVKELILAMNPNLEGESTAMYISRLVKPIGITVTRLAQGLSVGGDLEYADEVTLSKAIMGRTEM
ncbi:MULTISPECIES: recombination mediator RecR [Staphylococcus]|jgi:recombination protein RecR|uniref:Recombination protein RecR n=1 Tax=Staphylococcus nepalensis TaxID=214473 RepID=A0A291JMJ9_9STAP|nr:MULTISPECIES: recombination mediator RecR [Staphylococcus]VDG68112.1 recombination protein RecR [Lacrimispora indolis]ATH61094.1 recombination protein RecR [Staphylococcus nepalensis]ATH66124.1 recombination protein RecR [Staphylococcus nepalensis]AWI45514.1 recombination protein RecR [Staphylococcus nepalensis]MBO1205880.1 recombination protein RecR [Staphylococcus nepalensis]